MRTILLGALTALMVSAANAQDEDANNANFLLPYCKLTAKEARANPDHAYLNGDCDGTINAVMQLTDRTGCTPIRVTVGQAKAAVLQYAELHPEQTKGSFILLAIFALRDAWPCKPNR